VSPVLATAAIAVLTAPIRKPQDLRAAPKLPFRFAGGLLLLLLLLLLLQTDRLTSRLGV
jgi:hypothetical protein